MEPEPNEGAHPVSADEVQQLHDELGPALAAFLRTLLDSEADAADCLQNCFAILVQRGGQCAPAARRAWLYQVARNQAALARRQAGLQQRVLRQAAHQDGSLAGDQQRTDEVVAGLLADERREEVRQALACLPEAQRMVVEMRIHENLTFQEIATRLNIPLGTALGRMRGALKRLAVLLADES